MHRIAKQIWNKLQEVDNILIIMHQNPDGDAIGSASAMAECLRELNKTFHIFCSTSGPEYFSFLPHTEHISTNPEIWNDPCIGAAIVLDSGDLHYAGIDGIIKNLNTKPYILNIDHHETNDEYGNLNLVMPQASSTTEILYSLFKYNGVRISNHMATALLTGLVTDTDNFSNAGTSKKALKIASMLINKGANYNRIKARVLKNRSVDALRFWGIALSRLTIHKKHNIAYTYFTQKDMKEHRVTEQETEGISNLMNHLTEGKAALIAREREDGIVKISLRTTKDNVDVSKIAKQFGGGGHKKAAGFSLEKPIEEAVEHVFNSI